MLIYGYLFVDINEGTSSPYQNDRAYTDMIDAHSYSCAPMFMLSHSLYYMCTHVHATPLSMFYVQPHSCYPTHYVADINECYSQPCENAGVCIEELDGYTCECHQGFVGTYCETGRRSQTHYNYV